MNANNPNSYSTELPPNAQEDLLDAFRSNYYRLEGVIQEALIRSTDSTVLARLGDDLDEYTNLVSENFQAAEIQPTTLRLHGTQHIHIFSDPAELQILQNNLGLMRTDIRNAYREAFDASHHGFPDVVGTVRPGNRGHPQIIFDPDFLAWAYNRHSISSLARYLSVGRTTLRNVLINYGIMAPHLYSSREATIPVSVMPANYENTVPIDHNVSESLEPPDNSELPPEDSSLDTTVEDDLLEPDLPLPSHFPQEIENLRFQNSTIPENTAGPSEFIGYHHHSLISDIDLDDFIIRLRHHYRRAGIRVLGGMLRRLGHRVQFERIRQSLLRIDPVRRIFERIRIRRRTYSVAGPNALWHHDGQHGLIRWGIIIHGFIDGYSRLITGLQASSNNSAETVLTVFLSATAQYGVPSRVRGDHGTKNILVAAWMEERRGMRHGSYIWGRSVHNVRIERLWVDITAQIGATWSALFTLLELRHGLDINNANHVWLLQFLFLSTINQSLKFFAESWNEHSMQIRNGPNRLPADMFYLDMLVHGVRGENLEDMMTPEELEVYGIDWEALRNDHILRSQQINNDIQEGASSWLGRAGPPDELSEVRVDSPGVPLNDNDLATLSSLVREYEGRSDDVAVISAWRIGLSCAQHLSAMF